MDEDEIVEDGIVEQDTTDPLDSYRREQLTFEEVASRDEFQGADVARRLEIVDKLSAYNKGLYDGVEAESDISNIEAKTQLQKRLITSDHLSKNGPEWSREIHKSQYEAYAGFYDSDYTDYDFDIMEDQLNESQEKLAIQLLMATDRKLQALKYLRLQRSRWVKVTWFTWALRTTTITLRMVTTILLCHNWMILVSSTM